MKNLENYGVLEMETKYCLKINGGGNFVKLVGRMYGRLTEYYYRGSNYSWGGI